MQKISWNRRFIYLLLPLALNTLTVTAAALSFSTSSVIVSPTSLLVGEAVTISGAVAASGSISNAIIDLEIYNSTGAKVAQQFYTGQNFTSGQNVPFSWKYTIPAGAPIGKYTVELGIFSANWASNLYWNGSLSSYSVYQKPVFNTVSSSVSPSSVSAGQTVTFSGGVTSTANASNMIIDLEIYNAAGSRVAQQFYTGQNFVAGQAITYNWKYTTLSGAATGTYSLAVGVFSANWSTNLYWKNAVTSYALIAPSPSLSPAPSPTPTASPTPTPTPSSSSGGLTGLHVAMGSGGSAGHIVNSLNQIVQLHGANRAGSEWTCIWSSSFNDHIDQTSVSAMKAWHINAVRIPLNEDCWLNINGVKFGGANYQSALKTYVNLLTSNGMAVILDLHWAAPGSQLAKGQLGFADADHAPLFWSQVGAAYKGYSNVIFDLFNEPFITDWNCWLLGGSCSKDYSGVTYNVSGMAALLKSVRGAGANNVVILGGLGYSSDFSQWVAMVTKIPSLAAPNNGLNLTNVAASWHEYSNNANYNNYQYSCPNQWNGYTGTCPSAAQTGAVIQTVTNAGFAYIIGETEVSYEGYSQLTTWWGNFLTWVDSGQQSYFGWDWNTVAPPLLINDFNGTPSASGLIYKNHLAHF